MEVSRLPGVVFAVVSLLAAGPVRGQVVPSGVMLSNGSGVEQRSKPFEFRGPYTLTWALRDLPPSRTENPYWLARSKEEWKRAWLSVRVYDAASEALLAEGLVHGQTGHFNVQTGGKHVIVVSSQLYSAWAVMGKEGRMVPDEAGPRYVPNPPGGAMRNLVGVPPVERPEMEQRSSKWAPPAKPSSVPGLPAGVEPAAKKTGDLPPGMQRAK